MDQLVLAFAFIFVWIFIGFLGGCEVSSFLADRLEKLSFRVSYLERELEAERKRSDTFHGLAVIYCIEFQKARNEIQSCQVKLNRVKKWAGILNKIV